MKVKIIVAAAVILTALIFGASSFLETNVEYADFRAAAASHRKTQVKGEWERGQASSYDPATGRFSFVMKDEQGVVMPVVYDGARPNNFELATAIVVKGRVEGSAFHASEILTKCPSKYEAAGTGAKSSS